MERVVSNTSEPVTSSADAAQDNVTINVGAATTRPYDGQIVFFGETFESVETITVGSGGTGYTSTPTVTVDAPTGSSGETATAFATLEGECCIYYNYQQRIAISNNSFSNYQCA